MLSRADLCWLVSEPTAAKWTHNPSLYASSPIPIHGSGQWCAAGMPLAPLICITGGAAGAAGPGAAWHQVSAGDGAKGHRYYDREFLRLDHDRPALGEKAGKHWLMIRRNQRTGELATLLIDGALARPGPYPDAHHRAASARHGRARAVTSPGGPGRFPLGHQLRLPRLCVPSDRRAVGCGLSGRQAAAGVGRRPWLRCRRLQRSAELPR
jgi:hypothetical protein